MQPPTWFRKSMIKQDMSFSVHLWMSEKHKLQEQSNGLYLEVTGILLLSMPSGLRKTRLAVV